MINDKNYTPFVVFGTSKSGTTWLQKTLDAHPEISCKFQRPITPILKERINLFYPARGVFNAKRSPFNGLLSSKEEEVYEAELKLLNSLFSNMTGSIATAEGDLYNIYKEYYRKFIDVVLHKPGTKACGTKSYSDLDLFLEIMPEGKIVTIVRDPRDVIVSKRFHTLRIGAYFLGDEKNFILKILNHSSIFRRYVKSRYHKYIPLVSEKNFRGIDSEGRLILSKDVISKYAHEWVLVNEYILSIEKKYPNKLIRIKYEDLKTSYETELSRVFSFLEVTTDSNIIAAVKDKTTLQKEKVTGDKSFFRKGVSGDWINHLTPDNIQMIKDIVRPTAEKLRYKI